MSGPCAGWVPDHSVCSDWTSFDADTQAYADAVAIQVIWAATGREFGLCDVTVRPCRPRADPLYQTFPVSYFWGLAGVGAEVAPNMAGWSGVLDACGCGALCGCDIDDIHLPGPVASVTTVKVDGDVIDPSGYRLDGERLVRLGGQSWPASQDFALADTEEGTWSVTYQRGVAVPTLLQLAAGDYACEVAQARAGGACKLPARVQSFSRQGVDVQMVDTTDYLSKGLTGVATVDQIIQSFNPYGLKARPRVVSPDLTVFR